MNHNFNENVVQLLITGDYTSQFDEDVEVVVHSVDVTNEELDNINNFNKHNDQLHVEQYKH